MKKISLLGFALSLLAMAACSDGVTVKSVEGSKILVDARYDGRVSEEVAAFMAPYTKVVDSIMSPVVGEIAIDVSARAPESELSNLLADILVWAGKEYGEKPVMGVYNMGGIRASLTKGTVTYGDVLEVAPFDNKICFLTLSGENLMALFVQIADAHGEGVSKGVQLVITEDGKLVSAKLHGKEIDPKASYRIATIDYLAKGNGGLSVFKSKTGYKAPEGSENDCREVICRYFRAMKKVGKEVRPTVEGRIVVF